MTDTSLVLVKVFKLDSSRIYKDTKTGEYRIKRNGFPLLVQFRKKDSSFVNYYIMSELSPTFIYGNLMTGYPIGWLIDRHFDTRFRHKPFNYFSYDHQEKKLVYSSIRPDQAGDLRLSLGWSVINGYHPSLFPNYLDDGNVTPLGLSAQAEYFQSKSNSWMAEFGVSSTVEPKRRGIHFMDADSVVEYNSTNLWVLLNRRFHYKRWSFGGGISIAPTQNTRTSFYITHRDTVYQGTTDTVKYNIISPPKYTDQNLVKFGLNFNISYTFNNIASAGFNWQCYVADLNKNKFYASHFFNVYLGLKVHQFNIRRKPTLWK
jgi:hypothetical protein